MKIISITYTFLFSSWKKTMYGANVIIFEGILTFYNVDVMKVREIMNEME